LIFNTTTWIGAIGTLSLILLFIVGISYNLAKGRQPDCHCFGQLHSEPIGWTTLVRNGFLALLAAFLIWQGPGLSPVTVLSGLSAFQIFVIVFAVLVVVALAAEGWFIVNLLRQNGRLLLRLEELETQVAFGESQPAEVPTRKPLPGLPIGSPAPSFSLQQVEGAELTLDRLREAGKPVILLFTDPDCGPCSALMPQVAVWQREHASRLSIVVTSRGALKKNRALQREHGITHILLQNDREVSTEYQAYGTPSAVLIRTDGTIGSPLASGADAITSLIASTVKPPQLAQVAPPRQGARKGDPAPVFSLNDLDGKVLQSEDLKGKPSLLLFWNPGCGFCQRMLGQLKAWEANPPPDAPQLILISSGTVEDNRAMGIHSLIVLDQGFSTGRAFGAGGTPSAILIDAEGSIASTVAVGAPAVLALAAQTEPATL
jgi:peroxiredoxin